MSGSYYNEFDPRAAAWLRELIVKGVLPDGEVDTRSIVDVRPDDLRGFIQCHFFAGIGGWTYALRLAGWPDDRPIWTMSCPCQPFSAAGAGGGFADERHLWPAGHWLIAQCRPVVVVGEQVESPAGRAWLDLVCTDLEGAGYACGASDLPAAGVGAPHIRQRLYWVADADLGGPYGGRAGQAGNGGYAARLEPERFRVAGGLAYPGGSGYPEQRGQRDEPARPAAAGFWSDCTWLPCVDGKARPVEPGTFPLAYGVPARVGRLRGYGNAIVPQVAAVFIESYLAHLAGEA